MAKWVKSKKLKACPFCGEEAGYTWKFFKGFVMRMATVGYWGDPEKGRTLYWVGCNNSDCFRPQAWGDREEAFDKWNERTSVQ